MLDQGSRARVEVRRTPGPQQLPTHYYDVSPLDTFGRVREGRMFTQVTERAKGFLISFAALFGIDDLNI